MNYPYPPYLPQLPIDKVCKGKVKHPSYQSAANTLKGVHRNNATMQVYECPFCGKYHLGNAYKH